MEVGKNKSGKKRKEFYETSDFYLISTFLLAVFVIAYKITKSLYMNS